MSRISENIRKITKAWGGKTTGNGISDAVRDLAENLPFGEEEVTEEIEDYNGEVTGDTDTYTSLPNARFLSMGDLAVTINGEKFYGTSGTSNGVTTKLNLGKYYLYGEILEPGIKIMGLTPGETYSIQIARVEKKTVVTPIDIKYLPIDELKAALGIS